jgi:hypothetical protein
MGGEKGKMFGNLGGFRRGVRKERKVDEQVGAKNLVCVCEFTEMSCAHM